MRAWWIDGGGCPRTPRETWEQVATFIGEFPRKTRAGDIDRLGRRGDLAGDLEASSCRRMSLIGTFPRYFWTLASFDEHLIGVFRRAIRHWDEVCAPEGNPGALGANAKAAIDSGCPRRGPPDRPRRLVRTSAGFTVQPTEKLKAMGADVSSGGFRSGRPTIVGPGSARAYRKQGAGIKPSAAARACGRDPTGAGKGKEKTCGAVEKPRKAQAGGNNPEKNVPWPCGNHLFASSTSYACSPSNSGLTGLSSA